MKLEGQHILLTGAASGIGRALLERLAAIPCRIVAADIDARGLSQSCEKVSGQRAVVVPFPADLSQPAQVDALFDFAVRSFGSIDLFIANVGFAYYEQITSADWEHIERIYRLNVFSPMYAALKMRQINPNRPYRVVITASAMAFLALPGYALYSSTKAALDRFAEGYRLELDDPAALTLVYPIATRTAFFDAAARRVAPTPWPSQSPGQVAAAILRGLARDRCSIYPSTFFRLFLALNRWLPALGHLEQWLEKRRL